MGRGALISGARRTFKELRVSAGTLGALADNKSSGFVGDSPKVHLGFPCCSVSLLQMNHNVATFMQSRLAKHEFMLVLMQH